MNDKIVYKDIGDIVEDDILIDSEGETTTVTAAYDAHIPDKMFRLRFGNGETIEASGNHLWYTISGLDRQLHKQRIKEARIHLLPRLSDRKTSWLKRMSDVDKELSPGVDLGFIAESLDISQADSDLYNQVFRVLESIGPIAVRNEYYYDENSGSVKDAGSKAKKLYSLKLFCEQMLALVAEASGQKHRSPYELLKGKVRTTEDIAHTWDIGHDFPSTGKKAGILSMLAP